MAETIDFTDIAQTVREISRLPLTSRPLSGYIEGEANSLRKGPGLDFIGSRPYEYGDDTRRIDWKATARSVDNTPYVRETFREITPSLWIASDVPEHRYQANERPTERELGVGISIALMLMARRNNMPTGTVWSNGYETGAQRATSNKGGIINGLQIAIDLSESADERIDRMAQSQKRRFTSLRKRREPLDVAKPQERLYLSNLLDQLGHMAATESAVVVVSDFRDVYNPSDQDHGWEESMAQVAHRHDVIAIELTNRQDFELPLGVVLRDSTTGELISAQTTNSDVERYRRQQKERAAKIAETIQTTGARHLTIDTGTEDWVGHLESQLARLRKVA